MISDSDLDVIAERTFAEFCSERGYSLDYRRPFRRWWHAAFKAGLAIGVQLSQPKRRRHHDEDSE